jgi:hypothetical protein
MGAKDWAQEQIASLGRGYVKGQLRAKAGKYLQALQEGGMGYAEMRFMVDNDISYYTNFMPLSWKKEMFDLMEGQIKEGKTSLEDMKSLTEEDLGAFLPLFMEAIAEDFPWFVEAVSEDKKSWFIQEVSLFLQDLAQREKARV